MPYVLIMKDGLLIMTELLILAATALLMWLATWVYLLERKVKRLQCAPVPYLGVWAKLVGGPGDGKHIEVNLLRLPAKYTVPAVDKCEAKYYDEGDPIEAGTMQIGWHEYYRNKILHFGLPIEYLYMGEGEA